MKSANATNLDRNSGVAEESAVLPTPNKGPASEVANPADAFFH
jgi:hypothetical protein